MLGEDRARIFQSVSRQRPQVRRKFENVSLIIHEFQDLLTSVEDKPGIVLNSEPINLAALFFSKVGKVEYIS
jgi:hypothetical protein